MKRVEGVVTGVVKQIDAEGARLKLEFPWLEATYRSHWASIAAPMSGNNRGMFMMPEIDDEVLVAFEHGCIDHPFVIGFLWNGVDKCPHDSTGPDVRRLRTVSGHVVEFDDRGGKERVLIQTKGEHKIEMIDAPFPPQINIKTKGGQEVILKDQPASVTIKTNAGNKIEITDLPPSITVSTATNVTISASATGVTISAPTGMLTANCLQATINASALLNVAAPMTMFSGVVQASTVITQAVVSPVYTPGVGNLLGL